EDLGFYYVGHIDVHDVTELDKTLRILKYHKGPKLLHLITKKVKGYTIAESDPIKFHHVSPSYHSGENITNNISKQT
ncbi:1-deoxy-D-xylulose-5-phosphate synthase, partial [Francisella tularensis subsp. holarctica]|uniref:1-deoxy-D-xylulose-5-phosphate synthase N-terminal domain-containing protein n=1 Tax=Francisella tularensis TaxID=263 RepID=UPI002381A0E1